MQGYAAEEIQEGEQPGETESVTEVEETPVEEVPTTDKVVSEEVAPVEENAEVALDNPLTEETEEVKEEVNNEAEESVEDDDFDEEDYDGMATSVEESTTPTLNQFVETLPLEERVEFNKLLLDGTISMKCS